MPDSDAYLPWEDLGSPTFKLSNSLWALVPLEAWRRGLTVQLRPGARYVISGHGVTRSFRQTRLADPSSDQIARFCGDKNATNHVLAEAGVPVPRGMRFHSSDDQRLMLQFAAELGFPVCLKPNAWAKGRGVFPSVPDVEALDQLITHLIDDLESPDLLIEQHIRGENVRVVVAGDRAVAVTLMKAARVVGDGSASIEALVARRNEERKVNPYLGGVPIVVDELVHRHLAAQGLSLASVPERDRIVILTSTANISKGGDPIDITDQVSDSLSLDPPMLLGGSNGECSCGKQGWDCLRFSSAA